MIPLMRIYGNEKMEELLDFLPSGITMVEVGCWVGESTERFIGSGKVSKLIAVDQWKPWDISRDIYLMETLEHGMDQVLMDEVEKEFDKRVSLFGDAVVKMKGDSLEEAKKIESGSLDFVYIDSNHDYLHVDANIEAWLPKIKEGGYIGGHDYNDSPGFGVKKAVYERFGDAVRVFPDASWIVKVEKRERISVLTFCYNENFLMPYFLRHYSFADRIHVIVDADTNDGMRECFVGNSRVTTEEYRFPDMMDDILKVARINEVARSIDTDWLIVVDADEFVFSATGEGVRPFLARQSKEVNVVVSKMWQIYRHRTDEDLSVDGLPPVMQRRYGDPVREHGDNSIYCKPIVIRMPTDFRLEVGNHYIRGERLTFSGETLDGAHWAMADLCFAIDRRIAGRKDRQSRENIRLGHTIQHHHVTEEQIVEEARIHLDDPKLF